MLLFAVAKSVWLVTTFIITPLNKTIYHFMEFNKLEKLNSCLRSSVSIYYMLIKILLSTLISEIKG